MSAAQGVLRRRCCLLVLAGIADLDLAIVRKPDHRCDESGVVQTRNQTVMANLPGAYPGMPGAVPPSPGSTGRADDE